MSYNGSDVCHAWAHGEKNSMASANMSYNGRSGVLYSFSTCIGQRFETNGNVVFIMDTNRYSNTTAKHQLCMIGAIPDKDANTYIFRFPFEDKGRDYFMPSPSVNLNGFKKHVAWMGLWFLRGELEACKRIRNCKTLDHGFSRQGYDELVRFLKVTGVSTVSKILKMSSSEFPRLRLGNWLPVDNNLKKFLKLMHEGRPLPEICDAINGKGTWDAYMKRTQGIRTTATFRKISSYVGAPIDKKTYETHKKRGDLYPFLLQLRHEFLAREMERQEERRQWNATHRAEMHLKLHLGMIGWESWQGNERLTSFNYNGVVVNFQSYHRTRSFNEYEYGDFVKCADKEKWMHDKKAWMLEQLQQDESDYHRRQELKAKEQSLCAAEWERLNELSHRTEYIAERKAQGAEGIRALFHEGFKMELWKADKEVFNGGNVLLRYNSIRDIVETSKGIKIAVGECKRLWSIFKRWHNGTDKCVKGMEIRSLQSRYSVHSFDNNILTAGCHQIAWSEMQYIANELKFE